MLILTFLLKTPNLLFYSKHPLGHNIIYPVFNPDFLGQHEGVPRGEGVRLDLYLGIGEGGVCCPYNL